jgi:hypothetical protein
MDVRQKGATGEREICDMMNGICWSVYKQMEIPYPGVPIFQRNQNQSAVGGSDITNQFGLAIEVKRQEILSIEAWWKQCTSSAATHNEIPILLYRQNGKRKWNCVMLGFLDYGGGNLVTRVEISHEAFMEWARKYIEHFLVNNI